MIKEILIKAGVAVAILFVIVTLTFFLVHLAPGDPAQVILGNGATPQQLAKLHAELGLDKPVLTQYGEWMGGLLRGDLGVSIISGQPVSQALATTVPVTLSLTFLATALVLVVGVLAGTISAVLGKTTDRVIQGSAGVIMAVPNYWLAIALVTVFSIALVWLPATGYVFFAQDPSGWARSLVLPVIAIGLAGAAAVARQTRGALIDTFSRDYVRTLRALGTPVWVIVLKHGLRNASIPIITSIGLQFIGILGGAVIIEQVFTLPGIGQLTLTAVNQHDFPIMQGAVIFMAVVVLIVNILTDVIYALLNPKLRHR